MGDRGSLPGSQMANVALVSDAKLDSKNILYHYLSDSIDFAKNAKN